MASPEFLRLAKWLMGQVGNQRRAGNPPATLAERAVQRRLPTGAQDAILPPSIVWSIRCLTAAVLLVQPALGQSSSGGGGRPAVPASLSPTNAPAPVHISGKVALEDGSPPPSPAVIERLCDGVHAEGYTDAAGKFSLDLGRDIIQDPTVIHVQGSLEMNPAEPDRPFMNCRIRASVPGYRSEVVSMETARPPGRPMLGTIVLHLVGHVEGRLVSPTSMDASKDARKAFDKGQDSARKTQVDQAIKDYQKAVQLYPEYAAAWFELGRLQVSRHQNGDARDSFNAALKADPKFLSPYVHLSALAEEGENWADLADVTGRWLALDGFDYPEAFFYNALANFRLQKLEEAEKSARQTLEIDAQRRFPDAFRLLASILVERRQVAGACEQLSNYLKMFPNAPDAVTVRADLERLQATLKR